MPSSEYTTGIPHHETLDDYGKIDDHNTHVVNYSYESYLTIVCVQAPPKKPTPPAADGSKDHVFRNLLVTRFMIHWNRENFLPTDMHFLLSALFESIYDALCAANIALVHGGYMDQEYLNHIDYGTHHLDHPSRHKVVMPHFALAPRDTHGLSHDDLLNPENHPQIKKSNDVYEIYAVHVPDDGTNQGNTERFMIKWKDPHHVEERFHSMTDSALCYSEAESQRLALLTMKKEHWYHLVPHADLVSYACEAYFIAKIGEEEYVIVWADKAYCQDPDLIDKTFFLTDFDANEAAELAMTDNGWFVVSASRHDNHYLKYGYPYGLNHDDFMHMHAHEHPNDHHHRHHGHGHDHDHHDDHHHHEAPHPAAAPHPNAPSAPHPAAAGGGAPPSHPPAPKPAAVAGGSL